MRRAGLLLAAILTLAAPVLGAESGLGPAETVILENGLRLVLAPDTLARSVDVAVWYDAGARHDKPGKAGVAHLFEHLMFRGSSKFGPDEHGRLVRAEGGTSGAYATHDFIAFYETLPPDALELALRLEADRMTGLQLTQAGLDAERSLVAGERRARGTPISVGIERLYALAFPSHPYGNSVYGREADLRQVTLQDLREFYRGQFGPGGATVTVVGNFERDQALALARRHLEPLKGAAPRATRAPALKPQTAEQRAVERAEVPVRVVLAGWRVPPRSDPTWPAYSVLSTLLTRASDAPIAQELMLGEPLGLSVQGDVDSRRDASMFYLALAVVPGADSAGVERRLMAAIARVATGPVSEVDLERAKRQTETGVWFGLQTPRGRAQALGTGQVLAGDPRDLDRLMAGIRACQAEDVARAARSLDVAHRNLVWLLPSERGAAAGGGR
jgi:zinc protease